MLLPPPSASHIVKTLQSQMQDISRIHTTYIQQNVAIRLAVNCLNCRVQGLFKKKSLILHLHSNNDPSYPYGMIKEDSPLTLSDFDPPPPTFLLVPSPIESEDIFEQVPFVFDA